MIEAAAGKSLKKAPHGACPPVRGGIVLGAGGRGGKGQIRRCLLWEVPSRLGPCLSRVSIKPERRLRRAMNGAFLPDRVLAVSGPRHRRIRKMTEVGALGI